MLKSFQGADWKCCPVCGGKLAGAGTRYALREIFDLWNPIEFPATVIAEHTAISPHTELFRCAHCELEIFLPKVIGLPSFYAAASAVELSGVYYEDTKWDFFEALRDVQVGTRLIEFGCGPGNFLLIARERAAELVGVEFNPAAAEVARTRGLIVHESDRFPGSRQGQFDIAFSFHVLEHVGDPKAFVEALAAQVTSNGCIGLSVPNQDGPIRYMEPCAMNMPPHHATRWRLRTFEVLAEQLGWAIRRVSYEPLLLNNHSYYSIYWVNHVLTGSHPVIAVTRKVLSALLRAVFGLLRRMGLRYFPLLRGQSIYVLMSRRTG